MADAAVGARGVIATVVDPDSWESWDQAVAGGSASPEYAAQLSRAADRAGTDESVLTGSARLQGIRVVLVVSEFGFLGGSIGAASGARVVAAIRRATSEKLPVVALPSSGGTRMQEGTSAFLQMAAISAAVGDHRRAGLPYLVYLRHPTTGGVFASWGSLGQITWAQPGAMIGFLGPRVYEGLYGKPFPDDVQTAENLLRHGLIDDVVDVGELRDRLARVIAGLVGRGGGTAVPESSGNDTSATEGPDVWEAVSATRDPARAGLRELLAAADDLAVISDDGPIWLMLCRFGAHRTVVIGQERVTQERGRLIGPADLRVARRGIVLAVESGLPIVTVVDTPGAELSVGAENGGLAGEIAFCTADLIAARVPTVSMLLGQGAGGAALALFPADRRIAARDAWLSPLPPEGASLIVHRDVDHAPQEAQKQGIGAVRLAAAGQIDVLVDWSGDTRERMVRAVGEALESIVEPGDPMVRARVGEPIS